jgi:adenine phosphoribosyltransferase
MTNAAEMQVFNEKYAHKLKFIKETMNTVQDFPINGVLFYDIMGVLHHEDAFEELIKLMCKGINPDDVDYIAGIEARGFLLGPPMALRLGVGFVPLRKAGKLPPKTISESYDLEYGTATIEVAENAFKPGDNVIVVDDVLATGGTALAAQNLIKKVGANVIDTRFVIELMELGGGEKVGDENFHALYQL